MAFQDSSRAQQPRLLNSASAAVQLRQPSCFQKCNRVQLDLCFVLNSTGSGGRGWGAEDTASAAGAALLLQTHRHHDQNTMRFAVGTSGIPGLGMDHPLPVISGKNVQNLADTVGDLRASSSASGEHRLQKRHACCCLQKRTVYSWTDSSAAAAAALATSASPPASAAASRAACSGPAA